MKNQTVAVAEQYLDCSAVMGDLFLDHLRDTNHEFRGFRSAEQRLQIGCTESVRSGIGNSDNDPPGKLRPSPLQRSPHCERAVPMRPWSAHALSGTERIQTIMRFPSGKLHRAQMRNDPDQHTAARCTRFVSSVLPPS